LSILSHFNKLPKVHIIPFGKFNLYYNYLSFYYIFNLNIGRCDIIFHPNVNSLKYMSKQEELKKEVVQNVKKDVLERIFSKDNKAVFEMWNQNQDNAIFRVPEILSPYKESSMMWDLVLNPTMDKEQIVCRQELLNIFIKSESLDEMSQLKDSSYLINEGIKGIFGLVEIRKKNKDGYGANHFMMALEAYWKGYLSKEVILKHIGLIKKGQEGMEKLIEKLSEMDKPIINEIKEILNNDLTIVKKFDENYFLIKNKKVDQVKTDILNDSVNNHLMQLGTMMEFANVVVRESLTEAIFDDSKSARYSQGRHIARKKKCEKPEVINDSVDDLPISILCGANSGGKSYKLETDLLVQLFVQSIGYAPVKDGNFRIFDSIVSLGTTSTDSFNNLSAHGAEVIRWKNVLEKIGKKVFMLVDEGFSGTSAEDQYCLLAAVAEYVKNNKGKIILASHNEAFVNNYNNNPQVAVYNFPFILDKNDDGSLKIEHTHIMEKGKGDPKAIEIAESMGMDPDIIKFAKEYIGGELNKVDPLFEKEWKNIETYSDEERKELKRKCECSIFDIENSDDRIFHSFSSDEDISPGYNECRIITGEKMDKNKIWKNADFSRIRKDIFFKLLTESRIGDNKEDSERKKIFTELSNNDRYHELREIGNKACRCIDILSNFERLTFDNVLLSFNKVFRLDKVDHRYNYLDYEFGIMFLNLNKKALKEEFPANLEISLEKLEIIKKFFLSYFDYYNNVDIFKINEELEAEYNKPITEKSIIARFKAFTSDDPNMEKWGDLLTFKRIKEYLSWSKENNHSNLFDTIIKRNNALEKLIDRIMNGTKVLPSCSDSNPFYDKVCFFNAKYISDSFLSLAANEPIAAKNKWGDKITLGRLMEYKNFLMKEYVGNYRKMKFDRQICNLEKLIFHLESRYLRLNIKDKKLRKMYSDLFDVNIDDNQKIFGESVEKYVLELMRPFYNGDFYQNLPTKSFFDCEVESMTTEIKFFANYYHQREMYNEDENSYELIHSSFLEMFVDKNYFEEFTKLLKSYDSVYLHQIANKFEKIFNEHLPLVEKIDELSNIDNARSYFERNKNSFKILCDDKTYNLIVSELHYGLGNKLYDTVNRFRVSGPQCILNVYKAIYDNKIKDMYNDYRELDKLYNSIFEKHKIRKSCDLVDKIRSIYDNPTINNRELLFKNLYSFKKIAKTTFEQVTSGDSDEWVDQNTFELEKKNYEKFYQEYVINSGWKRKMGMFLDDLDGATKRLISFKNKYNISFESRENDERYLREYHRNGEIESLEREINMKYYYFLKKVIKSDYNYDENKRLMINTILQAETLGLMGHIIKTNEFCKNNVNTDGSINIKGLFSVFKQKKEQILNDISLEKDKYVTMIEAPNMSGKTFLEKALTMAVLWGIYTDYFPAEYVSIPKIEKVLFLDKINCLMDKNYGAMGNEVTLWQKLLKIIKNDKMVFAITNVDEAFSTTSPKYQASFVYAIVMEMIKQSQYLTMATHNHDVINKLRKLEKEYIEACTLDVKIDENSKVTFDYKLRKLQEYEWSGSLGVEVAKTLGMPVEIIEMAERIKRGLLMTQNGRTDLNYS
jgi:DNA mismatch repair ATPase MutS